MLKIVTCTSFPDLARQQYGVCVSLVSRLLEPARLVLQANLAKLRYSEVLSTLARETSKKWWTILCLKFTPTDCGIIVLNNCLLGIADPLNSTPMLVEVLWLTNCKVKQEHSCAGRSHRYLSMWPAVLFLVPFKYFTLDYGLYWSYALFHYPPI